MVLYANKSLYHLLDIKNNISSGLGDHLSNAFVDSDSYYDNFK